MAILRQKSLENIAAARSHLLKIVRPSIVVEKDVFDSSSYFC